MLRAQLDRAARLVVGVRWAKRRLGGTRQTRQMPRGLRIGLRRGTIGAMARGPGVKAGAPSEHDPLAAADQRAIQSATKASERPEKTPSICRARAVRTSRAYARRMHHLDGSIPDFRDRDIPVYCTMLGSTRISANRPSLARMSSTMNPCHFGSGLSPTTSEISAHGVHASEARNSSYCR